jgi:4-amino-4-deoxy-L-arabinose transferase-like glycosyltransferase
MFELLSKQKYLPLLIFALAWALYLNNSGGVSIYILDEAKNTECAREMLERSDFIVPTFNQILRTDKPPLHYFFMMLSYSVFGVNPFAARFFSALFGALTVLISYLFTRKYAGAMPALLTAFVLLASIHLSVQFHLAVPDPYLVFFMTAALFSFYLFWNEKKPVFGLALYLAIGLGVLAKGPVAIALPGLILLLFLLFNRQLKWPVIRRLYPFGGAVLVLLIALPWYLLVHQKTGGAWTEGFFLKHNLGRFSEEMEGHGGTFLLTLLYVLIGLFPFSVYLPQAVRQGFRDRQNPFVLFNLVAGLVIVGFFMLSKTRLPNYTVPALPFLAILTGLFLHEKWNQPKALTVGLWVFFVFGMLLVPAVLVGLRYDPSLKNMPYIAWYFLPFPMLACLALYFFYKRKIEATLGAVLLTGMITGFVFFRFAFPVIDRQNPVAQSLGLLEGKEVRYFQKFNSAYVFNLKREIPKIEMNEIGAFFDKYPQGVIISTQKKIRQTELPANAQISFSAHDLFESPTTVLITRKR